MPPNQRGPPGPPSLKHSPFREITSARPSAPLSPFSLFIPGAAQEGAAPGMAWGTGVSAQGQGGWCCTGHPWGMAQAPGRPYLEHVSGGALGVTCPS